jgi:hypothetical protein
VWVQGVRFVYSQGGMNYSPSVWHSEPFPNREAVVRAGKETSLDTIDRLAPVSGAVAKAEMRQLRKEIQGELEQGLLF